MAQELIPFGKHKGEPVEALAGDKNYTQWLLSQPWFKEKFQNIYTIVINNFLVPENTPEHNKMHVKFLERDYSLKLAYYLNPDIFQWNSARINEELTRKLNRPGPSASIVMDKIIERYGSGIKLLRISEPTVESGYDVAYSVSYGVPIRFDYESPTNGNTYTFELVTNRMVRLIIEIKPTIGDDFPSVLRQMKASMPIKQSDSIQKTINCLLVGEYTGEGATKEQFQQFFETQKYKVIFASEIGQVKLPLIEEDFHLNISTV